MESVLVIPHSTRTHGGYVVVKGTKVIDMDKWVREEGVSVRDGYIKALTKATQASTLVAEHTKPYIVLVSDDIVLGRLRGEVAKLNPTWRVGIRDIYTALEGVDAKVTYRPGREHFSDKLWERTEVGALQYTGVSSLLDEFSDGLPE